MRQKKKYAVITFRSTTEAMAMERLCMEHQVPGRLIPLPKEISAGCGLACRMLPEELAQLHKRTDLPELKYETEAEVWMY